MITDPSYASFDHLVFDHHNGTGALHAKHSPLTGPPSRDGCTHKSRTARLEMAASGSGLVSWSNPIRIIQC